MKKSKWMLGAAAMLALSVALAGCGGGDNMHTLSGNWRVRYECHVANAGDWLVIWSSNDSVAFFERTGSHDELFR